MLQNVKLKIPSSLDILRNLPRARAEWRYKKPLQKFCYLYGIGKMALSKVKLPIFEEDRSVKWFSYFAFMYIGSLFILAVYTAIYWTIQGGFYRCLPCTIMVFTGCGVSAYCF